MIPEWPTEDNIRAVLDQLTVYTWYDPDTGQDCGEALVWIGTCALYTPPYKSARY